MCNCIKDIEQRMQKMMEEEIGSVDNIVVKERVEFTNKGISFGKWAKAMPVFLFLPIEGKYMRGKQVNKWRQNLTLNIAHFVGINIQLKREMRKEIIKKGDTELIQHIFVFQNRPDLPNNLLAKCHVIETINC